MVLWPQASKKIQNGLGPVKKELPPPRMSPNVVEINEDKIYKDKCCGEFYPMFFLVMLNKNVGPVKILQDQ